jgi:hypothetical protein
VIVLPPSFPVTRESLRAVACYAVSPARKAETGRIGLRSWERGFATPPFSQGTRITVEGDILTRRDGRSHSLRTVAEAAAFLEVVPSPDPGVGRDLPPFTPDAPLAIDVEASHALGAWYAFGQLLLEELARRSPPGVVTEPQLWPEHFDLAAVVTMGPGSGGARVVNVGCSPGDAYLDEPYLYVGPHDRSKLDGPFWNTPFGAALPRSGLGTSSEAERLGIEFLSRGLELVARP